MIVHVGSILHSYTGGRSSVEAQCGSLGAVLDDLERRFPGIRFRLVDEQDAIRPHIRIYVGRAAADDLRMRVPAQDEIHILQALSGG